jgi:hypothetical protein
MEQRSGITAQVGAQRHFSPWLDVERGCRTCEHAIGTDGPHLFCRRFEIVVVMPCGAWQRAPGCD